jgi:hypothetical protein
MSQLPAASPAMRPPLEAMAFIVVVLLLAEGISTAL